ncbi:uncharacterized protein LOC117901342 [Drosophila subobscura]|uniref:uncharacterized protein LOC117901342 n=1 Tax=Drosophila subobscura TaxID=7241 RepID=UPI00155AF8F1|nr:uncharacterized protein LOC117901342 [Drosophila subobscura]
MTQPTAKSLAASLWHTLTKCPEEYLPLVWGYILGLSLCLLLQNCAQVFGVFYFKSFRNWHQRIFPDLSHTIVLRLRLLGNCIMIVTWGILLSATIYTRPEYIRVWITIRGTICASNLLAKIAFTRRRFHLRDLFPLFNIYCANYLRICQERNQKRDAAGI